MVTVQCVAAPAEVIIFSVRGEHIVDVIVKPFETEGRPHLISLSRVVEHDVQDYVDLIVMKRLDQPLEFHSFPVIFDTGRIACVRREEADRIVSPVIEQFIVIDEAGVPHLVELKDWHQFHCIDPQFLQIRYLLFQSAEGAGAGDS